MNAIVVVDKNWAIGMENSLLVHLPGDLKYFKEKTLGKILIMGRKTLESLPGGRPLPGRITIVLTGNSAYTVEDPKDENTFVYVCNSLEEITALLLQLEVTEGLDPEEDVFVAGGESIYSLLFPYCHRFFVTKIDAEYNADCHFVNLDKLKEGGRLGLVFEGPLNSEKGVNYRFTEYARV